jgi:hypothetical protein
MMFMTSWKPKPREPAKTKAELREMLAEAVRKLRSPSLILSSQEPRRIAANFDASGIG